MIWRRLSTVMGVLAVGVTMSVAPIAPFQAGAAPGSFTAALKPGACGAIGSEQAQAGKLESSLATALTAGKFSTLKQALLKELGILSGAISKAKGYLGGTPANVQAAFNTISGSFNGLKSSIQRASGLRQVAAAFTSFGNNPKLASASHTLASYFGTRCGKA